MLGCVFLPMSRNAHHGTAGRRYARGIPRDRPRRQLRLNAALADWHGTPAGYIDGTAHHRAFLFGLVAVRASVRLCAISGFWSGRRAMLDRADAVPDQGRYFPRNRIEIAYLPENGIRTADLTYAKALEREH